MIILLLAQSSINKPIRAKSVGREKTDDETSKTLSAPKKPVPPPKSKEVLARAKSHPVPTKDNLRKVIIFLSLYAKSNGTDKIFLNPIVRQVLHIFLLW